MSKRKKCTVIAVILLLGGVLWWLLVPKEPSYQGKTLTEWQAEMLNDISDRGEGFFDEKIIKGYETPIRAMGKKTFPFLLKQIRGESEFEVWVIKTRHRLGFGEMYLPELGTLSAAVCSLKALGDESSPIIPEIVRMAKARNHKRASMGAQQALAVYGLDSDEYLSILVEVFRTGTDSEKNSASSNFFYLGKKATKILPELLSLQAKNRRAGTNDFYLELTIGSLQYYYLKPATGGMQ